MRTLLLMVGMLLGFPVWSQPIQRQFFTTNLNPRVIVAAGTNVTVQYTTTGTDIRTYTVNSSGGGGTGQTNWDYTAITNAPWQWGSQNLTNWSQLSTNLLQDLDQTNWPYTSITNAPWQWGSQNLTNWSQLSTNDLAALTNGYPWTNLTVAIAGAVTNGYPWTNIYSPGISGGSTNQVYTQTGWSGYPQVTNLSLITNGMGTAIVPVLHITNGSPASLGVQQASGALMFDGQGFRSGNSTTMPVSMGMYVLPVQGSSANPTASIQIIKSISNAVPSLAASISSGGALYCGAGGQFVGGLEVGAAQGYFWTGSSGYYAPANGDIQFLNNAQSGFNRLYLGKVTSDWPAIKVETSTNNPSISIRTGADANYASLVASNVTATATVFANSITSTNGGTVGGAVLSTSSTTNSPAVNELATAGWTRSLFAGAGVSYYATTNVANTFTNADYAGGTNFEFSTTIPPYGRRLYVDPAVNSYVGSVVVTNKLLQIDANIVVNAYLDCVAGTGSGSLQVRPEIYVSYDGTNWIGDWIAASQTITPGVTNLYQWVVSNPAYVTTNATGFYVQRRFKIMAQTSNNNADLGFNLGTNFPSHISLPGQNTSAGMAYLAANQTFTGTNTFTSGTRTFLHDSSHTVITNTATLTGNEWTAGQEKYWYNAVNTILVDKTNGQITAKGFINPPSTDTQSNTVYWCNLSKSGSYIINPTTNDIQFIATGMVAGASCDILLFGSTTNCNLTFDASLTNFIGTPAPTLLSSNKVGELKLKSWDTTAAHVTLYWGSTVP